MLNAPLSLPAVASEWSKWDARHGRLSREVAVERGGSGRDTMEPTGVERHRWANRQIEMSGSE
jgi:hypothetical protein